MTAAPTSSKPRFPRAIALEATREILAVLTPCVDRVIVAGSLRRRREEVGDVEIVYLPRFGMGTMPGELIPQHCCITDAAIAQLEVSRILERRLSKTGAEAFGPKNKLMRHVRTGVPVDLFATTPAAWWNYVVCRTGPGSHNIKIAERAKALGFKWHPYHAGFENLETREIAAMQSERHVFEFLGWEYREPWERE